MAERKCLTELEDFGTIKYAIIRVVVNDSAQTRTLKYYKTVFGHLAKTQVVVVNSISNKMNKTNISIKYGSWLYRTP